MGMTPEQQWQEDVKNFGELAYLMWYSYGIRDYPENIYVDFDSNYEVFHVFNYAKDDRAERKQSAALPFDLAAATAGDEVEHKDGSRITYFESPCQTTGHDVYCCDYDDVMNVCYQEYWFSLDEASDFLKMKHPRRVGVDYSRFEDKV